MIKNCMTVFYGLAFLCFSFPALAMCPICVLDSIFPMEQLFFARFYDPDEDDDDAGDRGWTISGSIPDGESFKIELEEMA